MKQIIAGIVLATAMTTTIAETTRAEKVEYCYTLASMSESMAKARDSDKSLGDVLEILERREGLAYKEVLILIYENPNVSPKDVRNIILNRCLEQIKDGNGNTSSNNKQFKGEI